MTRPRRCSARPRESPTRPDERCCSWADRPGAVRRRRQAPRGRLAVSNATNSGVTRQQTEQFVTTTGATGGTGSRATIARSHPTPGVMERWISGPWTHGCSSPIVTNVRAGGRLVVDPDPSFSDPATAVQGRRIGPAPAGVPHRPSPVPGMGSESTAGCRGGFSLRSSWRSAAPGRSRRPSRRRRCRPRRSRRRPAPGNRAGSAGRIC